MTIFKSKINVDSENFKKHRNEMLELIARLEELNGRASIASERRKERFEARGQLTPRERLARLLDPGLPFLQIGNLAGYMLDTKNEKKSIPGSTVISGIGFISGVRCMVVVDDSGINAGALMTGGGYRISRSQEIALQQKLPFCSPS